MIPLDFLVVLTPAIVLFVLWVLDKGNPLD